MKSKQKTNPKEVKAFAISVLNFRIHHAMTWQRVAEVLGYRRDDTVSALINKAYSDGAHVSQKNMDRMKKIMEAYDVAH